ncbi:MAG: fibrobacter succinogenes major paralogous domain-containing protein [Bacteroidales bacterium]
MKKLLDYLDKHERWDIATVVFIFWAVIMILLIGYLCQSCTEETTLKLPDNVVYDADNNSYHIVVIGTQSWLKENLKTTEFNDGSPIPIVPSDPEIVSDLRWKELTGPGYCWYYNIVNKSGDNGALYNWYAATNNKLCPTGWYVPSDEEWKTLESFLGMDSREVDKEGWRGEGIDLMLKTNYNWYYEGTDDFGFSIFPVGFRSSYGDFEDYTIQTAFWTTTNYDSTNAWHRSVADYAKGIYRGPTRKNSGFSIRCIKNN